MINSSKSMGVDTKVAEQKPLLKCGQEAQGSSRYQKLIKMAPRRRRKSKPLIIIVEMK